MALYALHELEETLKNLNIIPEPKLKEVFNESKRKKTSPVDLLLARDLISDANLGKVIADMIGFPFIDLSDVAIDENVLSLVPEVYAKSRKVIAFKSDREGLHIATPDPADADSAKFVGKKAGLPVKVYYTTQGSYEEALSLYAKKVGQAFDEIIAENVNDAHGKRQEPSIIKIVETIIKYAYQNKSSDIHIEPTAVKSMVRFRVDGILHDIVELPGELHTQIVTRIKVLAKLRTDEHQGAQDGRITFELPEEDLDIRVSIVPLTRGEKIVMRLLSEKSRRFSLSDLGFVGDDLKRVDEARSRPHGMILSTGPTGSGKTTTLYAILKLLNKRDVNIMTIEDPVEYEIEGVNQIQVNNKTNLTFAEGLRSIVRQNPDIILVGEIRDDETADIAVNAAMTGHLVLSTLHTNDAATAFPRLLDFKVEPYLVASTINVVVAQRLVRKICVQCRISKEVAPSAFKHISPELVQKYLGSGDKVRIYEGKGCDVCHNSGYSGREGIFEVLLIDDTIRDAITGKSDSSEITKLAIKGGMRTMLENGLEKVKRGITTVDEVLRVIKE
jgi:type IV pilus assembly protein PilB